MADEKIYRSTVRLRKFRAMGGFMAQRRNLVLTSEQRSCPVGSTAVERAERRRNAAMASPNSSPRRGAIPCPTMSCQRKYFGMHGWRMAFPGRAGSRLIVFGRGLPTVRPGNLVQGTLSKLGREFVVERARSRVAWHQVICRRRGARAREWLSRPPDRVFRASRFFLTFAVKLFSALGRQRIGGIFLR